MEIESTPRQIGAQLARLYTAEIEALEGAQQADLLLELAGTQEDLLDDPASARDALNRALEAAPSSRTVQRRRAAFARRHNDPSMARTALEALVRLERDPMERHAARVQLVVLLQDTLGDREEAFVVALDALAEQPDDALMMVRMCLAQPDDAPATIEATRARLAAAPDDATRAALFLELGTCLEHALGDDDGALTAYRSALEAWPGYWTAIAGISRVLRRRKQWGELAAALAEAQQGAEDSQTRGRIAHHRLLLANEQGGEVDTETLHVIAACLADDWTAAWAVLPELERRGLTAPAIALLESMLGHASPAMAATLQWRMAKIALAAGDTPQAVERARRAAEASPGSPMLLAAWARLAWAAEDGRQALGAASGTADCAVLPEISIDRRVFAAEIAAAWVGDTAAADRLLQAVTQTPELLTDPQALVARARYLDEAQRAELAQGAVESAHDAVRIWALAEVARNTGVTGAGWAEVLAASPGHRQAAREVGRGGQRRGGVLEAVEAELATTPPRARQLALLIRVAQAAQADGDTAEMERVWRRALALDPQCRPAFGGLGRFFFEAERWADLAALHQLELDAFALSTVERGWQLARLAEVQEVRLDDASGAAETLELWRTLDPEAPEPLEWLERLYARLERWAALAEVRRHVARMLTEPQAKAAALYAVAEIEIDHLNQPSQAIESCEAALSLWPDLLPATWLLERLLLEAGDAQRVAALHRMLLERLGNRQTRDVVAWKAAQRLPLAESDIAFQALATAEGLDAAAIFGRARAAAARGDAVALAEHLVSFSKGLGAGRDRQAVLCDAAERLAARAPEGQWPIWEEALRSANWDSRPGEAVLGDVLGHDPSRAIEIYERLAGLSADPRVRSAAFVEVARLQTDLAGIEHALQNARRAHPDDPVPTWMLLALLSDALPEPLEPAAALSLVGLHEALGRTCQRGPLAAAHFAHAARLCQSPIGDLDRSMTNLLEATGRDPDDDDIAEAAVGLLTARGALDGVVELLSRRARRVSSPDRTVAILQRLGRLQNGAMRDLKGACGTYDRLVAVAPDDLDALLLSGDLHHGLGHLTQARARYEAALPRINDRLTRARLHMRLGQMCMTEEGPAAAAEHFRQVVGLSPDDAEAWRALGDAWLAASDGAGAVEAYRALRRLAEDPQLVAKAVLGEARGLLSSGREGEARRVLIKARAEHPMDLELGELANSWGVEVDTSPPIEGLAGPSLAGPSLAGPSFDDGAPVVEMDAETSMEGDSWSRLDPDAFESVEASPANEVLVQDLFGDLPFDLKPSVGPRPVGQLFGEATPPGAPLEPLSAQNDGAEAAVDVEAVQAQLVVDRTAIAPWRQLAKHLGAGSDARAVWLADIVGWISGTMSAGLAAHRAAALSGQLLEDLRPPELDGRVVALLTEVGPYVEDLLVGEAPRQDAQPLPDWTEAARPIAASLGVEACAVLRDVSRPYSVTLTPGAPPRLYIGADVLDALDVRGRSFLLARSLAPLRCGGLLARRLTDREFRASLTAILRRLGAPVEPRSRDRAMVERKNRKLESWLADPPSTRWTQLAVEAAEALEARSYSTLRSAFERTSDRLALAVCDSFGGAMEALRLLDFDERPRQAVDRGDLEQFLSDNDHASDLLAFATSEICLRARDWRALEDD